MAKKSEVRRSADAWPPVDLCTFSRRRFLQGLAALGASIALPGPFEQASAEAIDSAWAKAVAEPWYFEISEWGSIVEPGIPEPRVRSDVFEVWDRRPRDPDHLISEIEQIAPLQSAFQGLAEDRCSDLEADLKGLAEGSRRRACIERLLEEMSDPDEGWMAWIRDEGTGGIDQFWEHIQEWLDAPINWSESDWFPPDWHGQGRAYRFFRDMDPEVLAALGVVIIEGDHPGSDYFAAELRGEIDEANAAATNLGLPFRFRPEGVRS